MAVTAIKMTGRSAVLMTRGTDSGITREAVEAVVDAVDVEDVADVVETPTVRPGAHARITTETRRRKWNYSQLILEICTD